MTTTSTIEQSSTGNKPVETLRQRSIQASIWRNVNDKGYARFSVSIERRYTDDAGEWHSSPYFNSSEALVAAKLLDQANTRISELIAAERQQQGMAR